MTRIGDSHVLLCAVVLATSGCCGSSLTLPEEVATLPAGEREALETLLAASGLTLDGVRSVGVLGIANNPRSVAISRGHVVGLRLTGTKLARMDALAALPELTLLWLGSNQISEVSGLSRASKLTELVLEGNQITVLAGLEGCASLEKLDAPENRIAAVASLKGTARLKTLNLAKNAVRDFSGLQGHPTLETLVLSHNGLASVEGIRDLPALRTLRVDNNQLTTLAGLQGLPSLYELDASRNRLVDLDAIAPLPELVDVDVSHNALTRGPKTRPPHIWKLELEGNPRPKNWVERTPPYTYTGVPGSVEVIGVGRVGSGPFDITGSIEVVRGPRPVHLKTLSDVRLQDVTIELSVEQGRARAYLGSPPGEHFNSEVGPLQGHGYNVGDATPGAPATVKGTLNGSRTSDGFDSYFVLDSLGGEARGVRFRVYRLE